MLKVFRKYKNALGPFLKVQNIMILVSSLSNPCCSPFSQSFLKLFAIPVGILWIAHVLGCLW